MPSIQLLKLNGRKKEHGKIALKAICHAPNGFPLPAVAMYQNGVVPRSPCRGCTSGQVVPKLIFPVFRKYNKIRLENHAGFYWKFSGYCIFKASTLASAGASPQPFTYGGPATGASVVVGVSYLQDFHQALPTREVIIPVYSWWV